MNTTNAMLFLGTHKSDNIFTDLNQSYNQHMLVTGATGTGKTNFIKVLASQNTDRNVIILDYSSSFSQFENAEVIHILQTTEIQTFLDDLSMDTIPIIADAIQGAWRLGQAQQSAVVTALHLMNDSSNAELDSIVSNAHNDIFYSYIGHENNLIKKDWALLALILNTNCGPKGQQVAIRMLSIVTALSSNKVTAKSTDTEPITIIHFSIKYSGLNSKLVELYLWKFWLKQIDLQTPTTLILDECQDLEWKKGTIADRLLTEGRKFGIGIILSTQFLAANFPKRTINDFLQSGLRVIFAPSQGEVREIAQSLNAGNYKPWISNLKRLRVGECVVSGMLYRKEYCSKQILIISVPNYEQFKNTLSSQS